MALDNQHVDYFFTEHERTYIVEKVGQTKKPYCNNRTNKIVINPALEINLLISLCFFHLIISI